MNDKNGTAALLAREVKDGLPVHDASSLEIPKPQYGAIDENAIGALTSRVFLLERMVLQYEAAFDAQAAQIASLKAAKA